LHACLWASSFFGVEGSIFTGHVDGCRELVVRYEKKIKTVVDGVWGNRLNGFK
jgi:hypothetical protein